MIETLTFVFELIGTVAFAISGAITGLKKKMDIFGACVLGMTTAIGGGIIRDVILGVNPPAAFLNPVHAIIGFLIPAFTYFPKIQKFFFILLKIFDKHPLKIEKFSQTFIKKPKTDLGNIPVNVRI